MLSRNSCDLDEAKRESCTFIYVYVNLEPIGVYRLQKSLTCKAIFADLKFAALSTIWILLHKLSLKNNVCHVGRLRLSEI